MKRTPKYTSKSMVNILSSLLIILLFSLGCNLLKNPFRDYSGKPFSSQEWLAGDAVERGRMGADLFKTRTLTGRSREGVAEMLGEPEKKQTVEGREVWLYRVDLGPHSPMNYFPVSFEDKKGAFAGRVEGGTISLFVE